MKKLLLFLVLVVVAVMVAPLFLSGEWSVSRSVVIAAEPAKVHATVQDLRTWDDWSAWTKQRDPKAEFAYAGEPGVGQTWNWTSEGELGTGEMKITDSSLQDGLRYRLEMGEGLFMDGAIQYEAVEGGTRVSFGSEGTMSGMWKLMAPLSDRMIGPEYEKALEGLKTQLEGGAAPQPEAESEAAPEGEGN